MKNFLIYIVVSSAMSISGGLMYAKYYLSPKVKEMIQQKSSELLGTPVQIRDLRVLILPKISIAATGLKFDLKDPNLKVDIAKIYIEIPLNKSLFNRKIPFGPIRMKVEDPRFNYELRAQASDQKPNKPEFVTRTQFKFGRDFNLELKVERAKIKITQISTEAQFENETSFDPLDFEVNIPGIDKDWSFNVKAKMTRFKPALGLPFEMNGQFTYKDQILSVSPSSGLISGINFSFEGQQNFLENTADWKLVSESSDLSKLSNPPHVEHLKNFKGALKANISASLSSELDWQVFGDLKTKALSADLDFKQEQLELEGPILIDLDSKFSYAKSFRISSLDLNANLNDLEVRNSGFFNKPKQVPMSLMFKLSGQDQIFDVQDFNFDFLTLNAHLDGALSFNKQSATKLHFSIRPTSLSDWEKYFTFFGGAPLSGIFSLDSYINELSENDFDLNIQTLKLERLKGNLQYTSQDHRYQFKGPFDLNAEIKGPYGKLHTKTALSINGSANFKLSQLQSATSQIENSNKSQPTEPAPGSSEETPYSFYFPKFKSNNFKIDLLASQFQFNRLVAEGLNGSFNLADENINGSAKINKIDSGEIQFKNLVYNYKNELSEFSGEADFSKIDANRFVGQLNSDSGELVKGEASGQLSFRALLPKSEDRLAHFESKGRVHLKNAFISKRGIDDLINEKLAQIPGIGKAKPTGIPMGSDISMLFNFADSIMNISDFKLLTPGKNELQAKGSIAIPSENLNLEGNAFLADAPIGGDVKLANSDAAGRFRIPFSIQGNLRAPEANFAQNSIQEILKRTLVYVAKKESDKLRGIAPPEIKVKADDGPVDPDDVEEQETPALPTKTTKAGAEKQDKIEALKNRLQGIFEKHE